MSLLKLNAKKVLAITIALPATYLGLAYFGAFGKLETAGTVTDIPRPEAYTKSLQTKQQAASTAVNQSVDTQILFGDLHAHTTYSIDAFQYSLSLMGGDGASPPADACDFARYCSALDFWSINDHAEHTTPEHWQDTKDSIRQCNAVSGDPDDPDMVAYLGFEWTHAGTNPNNHYGHKNVIFKDTAEDQVPTRPIYAQAPGIVNRSASPADRIGLPLLNFKDRQRAFDFNKLTDTVYSYPECPEGVDVRELPKDCREGARTPKDLFSKLDQWGFDTMVIPHGNSWGVYTPPGTTWDKQLKDGQQRSDYQFLMEIFSGHGNSEEYRDWRAINIGVSGEISCPTPSETYTPSCWRAGEIIESRCLNDGGTATECEVRANLARQIYAENGVAGHYVISGLAFEDWQESGQCTDCYLPAFNLRPGGSAQYALSVTNFDDPDNPQRFNFGFMASSDNHTGRPGTGYKEYDRYANTETSGVQEEFARKVAYPNSKYSNQPREGDFMSLPPVKKFEHERSSSYFYTGGLIAVHSPGRDRDSIWNAMQKKQVYGTSGERILLWFDLLNGKDGKQPMGSEVDMTEAPRFRVSAVGAFKQKPGCPDYVLDGLTTERMESLCRGECYNPGDERRLITRIEIIRVRPQMIKDEPMFLPDGTSRIEDIWKTFDCAPNQNGCTVEFTDEEFETLERDVTYYARAIQEPRPTINAANLRTSYDESGKPIEVKPCYSDKRTDPSDECHAMKEGRAWSSPIFVNYQPR
ncbi:DUF3604 domain-containing protein [Maricurvus nonylphenolicus]|uniref:DUF3604 domain-containing protein n=1 Tax=Maricurvus nonylphenolicus TaxID=1008307 RepID=UPI0036F3EEF3